MMKYTNKTRSYPEIPVLNNFCYFTEPFLLNLLCAKYAIKKEQKDNTAVCSIVTKAIKSII